MKTIDFLVQELPKCGGWPEGATGAGFICGQGELYFWDKDDCCPSAWILDVWEAIEDTESEISRERYEAALAAKNDGWIDWPGGECPVEKGTLVDVKLRCGSVTRQRSGESLDWKHDGQYELGAIIAYRLHQLKEVEQTEAEQESALNECIGQDTAPVWNGEGLPPVGMEIEYSFAKVRYRTDFSRGKVLAYGMQNVFMEHWASKNEFIQPLDKIEFRPIRSEAEQKREKAVQALCDAGGGNGKVDEKDGYGSCWFDVYDAIAAGEIPGVKLED